MRKRFGVIGMVSLLSLAGSSAFAAAPAAKPGTVVIVFKDGHHQVYSLGEIERIEFPSGSTSGDATSATSMMPSRGRFLGKWKVGDGSGSNFFIRLEENGDAYRSLGDENGTWEYVDGEARVTWNDGAMDAIRKVGSGYQKSAYAKGKQFTDVPDNVTGAHNTSPHPI